jgi:anti-sigma-K factor RskA
MAQPGRHWTHNELRDQAAAFALGALPDDERLEFESHLLECGECEDDVRSFTRVATALACAAAPVEPPAALRARTLGAVRASSPHPAVKYRSVWLPWLAAAASLAIAAGLGAYALNQRQHTTEAQSIIVVMTADDLQRIDLAGQPAAPNATARAFWSRSRGLIFTASRLPPLPPGRIYQLWVIAGQTPVGAGLLRPELDGTVRSVLRSPVGLGRAAAFAVTIEPDGGVAAPTGDKYLVGLVN